MHCGAVDSPATSNWYAIWVLFAEVPFFTLPFHLVINKLLKFSFFISISLRIIACGREEEQTFDAAGGLIASHMGVPGFKSWFCSPLQLFAYMHFLPWEVASNGLSTWVPDTHVWELEWIMNSWPQLGPGLAVVGIRRVSVPLPFKKKIVWLLVYQLGSLSWKSEIPKIDNPRKLLKLCRTTNM